MSALRLITSFCFCLLAAVFAGGVARADWTYPYSDDFSTDKAMQDSYRHSMFWPKGAPSPSEPYVYYTEVNRNRGLAFVDYRDQFAELGYRFPLGTAQVSREVKGTIVLDVSFPTTAEFNQQVPGRLQYQTSTNGTGWDQAKNLTVGRQEISVATTTGFCYILFSGTRVVIDNLSVSLSSGPAALQVPRDYGTLQAAIDAAGEGDVIEVAPGTYSGSGFRDIRFRGKAITVCSTAGPESTIIDCGGAHRGFSFYEGEGADSVLSGLTIRSGRAPGSVVPTDPLHWTGGTACSVGGGIFCAFTSPTIENCIIEDCGALVGGGIGGIGASPAIIECAIEGCFASQSGGCGGAIGLLSCSGVTITGCTIRGKPGNSYSYIAYGAGLYFSQSAAEVTQCIISGNSGSATARGGGAYCTGSATEVTFLNCIFSHNHAQMGAGLYLDGTRGAVSVVNCTVTDNELWSQSTSAAAGIQSSGVDLLVTSSIVWGNKKGKALVISGDTYAYPVTYSDVEGGYAYAGLDMGNFDADPLFADPDAEDYHLRSQYGRYDPAYDEWVRDAEQSPCIDKGDPRVPVGDELAPNGNRLNVGAHGGTREASKSPERVIRYVDNTPGRHPGAYTSIREAMRGLHDGDTVLVWPGTYYEELCFDGNAITVQSADYPAVLSDPNFAVSFFHGEGSKSVLANFVITGCGKGGIFCNGASPTLKNLTIVGNGCGILAYGGSEPNIVNCIVYYNSNNCGLQSDSTKKALYSDIQDLPANKQNGSIQANPLFADYAHGNYHLKSAAGRWVPNSPSAPELGGRWVTDADTSPCIDAGDPRAGPGNEPAPNGGIINMGAYGGTPYASKSR